MYEQHDHLRPPAAGNEISVCVCVHFSPLPLTLYMVSYKSDHLQSVVQPLPVVAGITWPLHILAIRMFECDQLAHLFACLNGIATCKAMEVS